MQLANGMIPWFPGGHADPWNHVEAAMALVVAGRRAEAERALDWLASTPSMPDGSWCNYYLADGVEEPRRDTNVCAYVATGAWWHYLVTGDDGCSSAMWPVVDRAIGFVLRLQQPGGEVLWSIEPDGTPGPLRPADRVVVDPPQPALRRGRRRAPGPRAARTGSWPPAGSPTPSPTGRGASSPRTAGPWTGTTRCCAGPLPGAAARRRLLERWDEFVMDGLGVRCVSDQPWVTAAETAECVMALDAVGWTPGGRDAAAGPGTSATPTAATGPAASTRSASASPAASAAPTRRRPRAAGRPRLYGDGAAPGCSGARPCRRCSTWPRSPNLVSPAGPEALDVIHSSNPPVAVGYC